MHPVWMKGFDAAGPHRWPAVLGGGMEPEVALGCSGGSFPHAQKAKIRSKNRSEHRELTFSSTRSLNSMFFVPLQTHRNLSQGCFLNSARKLLSLGQVFMAAASVILQLSYPGIRTFGSSLVSRLAVG